VRISILPNAEASRVTGLRNRALHDRQTNAPIQDEVATIWVGDRSGNIPPLSGLTYTDTRDGRIKEMDIVENAALVDPLCFPVLCPYGTNGSRLRVLINGAVEPDDEETCRDQDEIANVRYLNEPTEDHAVIESGGVPGAERSGGRIYASHRQQDRYKLVRRGNKYYYN
jgi:hypothetical protein